MSVAMVAKVMFALMVIGLITIYGTGAHGSAYYRNRGWVALGCYKDSPDRAMKYFLGYANNDRTNNGHYTKCKKMAEDQGFDYFGIQNNVECWGSYGPTYDRHGCSKNCERGIGKDWANFVYYKKPVWTECTCNKTKKYKLVVRKDLRPNCPHYNKKVIPLTRNVKPCITHTSCPVDGGWSKFGPWSACDQLCGDGGKQTKTRTCTNPKPAHGGKDCEGPAQKFLHCNTMNCPTPCSFDGLLVQLLNNLAPGITVNNHMVTALSQVVRSIDSADSYTSGINQKDLLKKIKAGLGQKGGEQQARILLGLILAQQKDCLYAEVVKEIQSEIGEAGFKKLINADGDVTLTFTIDQTGSMRSVIEEAKAIAKAIAGYKRESSVDYVLSTFGEKFSYLTGEVQTFDKLKKFVDALDRLTPNAGGDCPEPTFAGIIKGIDQGRPKLGSPMYVFTDAPPKPFKGFTRDGAIESAKTSQMPINFFLTEGSGSCKDYKPRPQDSLDYKAIIQATGGIGLSFINATSMEKLKPMIEADLDGTTIVARGICRSSESTISKRASADTYFDISDIANTLQVHAAGTSNVNQGVKLFDPSGVESPHELVDGDTSKTWTIIKPTLGKWVFKLEDVLNFEHTIKVSAEVDITFEPTFYKDKHAIPYPLIGEKATAKIHIPNLSRLNETFLNFHLESSNERKSMTKNSADIYESDLPAPSGGHFKMLMKGKTLSGWDFQRESGSILPKYAAISWLVSDFLYVNVESIIKGIIFNSAPESKTFTITVTTDSSNMIAVQPGPVTVASGGTAEVQVKMTGKSVNYSGFPVKIEAKSGDLVLSLKKNITVYENYW